MKLHLGCGENYLEGYVNIDYPPSEHTVQKTSVADQLADITKLNYSPSSIQEIRMHHVFEHFWRAQACALLATWHEWLVDDGVLHLEVPDFRATAKVALNRTNPFKIRLSAERHIFGSQEAGWAIHYAGYTPETLKFFLENFGYKTVKIKKIKYKQTRNVDIYAQKSKIKISREDFQKIAKNYLKNYLIDESKSELLMLDQWMVDFHNYLNLAWPDEK
jgi:predicted SAM-dependent methyltransferase